MTADGSAGKRRWHTAETGNDPPGRPDIIRKTKKTAADGIVCGDYFFCSAVPAEEGDSVEKQGSPYPVPANGSKAEKREEKESALLQRKTTQAPFSC